MTNHQAQGESTRSNQPSSFVIRHSSWASDRSGLTLFEVLLVMTLLVLLGGLALPALEGAFSHARLQHAGDQLRAAWSRARLAALESGQTQAFRCAWGSDRYHVAAHAVANDAGGVPMLPSNLSNTDDHEAVPGLEKDRLTKGVVFVRSEMRDAHGRSTAGPTAPSTVDGDWSQPILFFADGTATDVTVVLENDRDWQLRVTLRGLTGGSRVGEASPATRVSP